MPRGTAGVPRRRCARRLAGRSRSSPARSRPCGSLPSPSKRARACARARNRSRRARRTGRVRSLLFAILEGSAQDVAQRCPGVRGAKLRHGLLLLGDLERLDGEGNALRLLVELGDAGIDLVALREALRTLVVAVAAQVGAADECRHLAVGELDLDATIVDLGDRTGHDRALLDALAA